MPVTFKVSGLRELGEAMRRLGDETALKVARSMTNAGAQVVKKEAIQKAPEHDEPTWLEGVYVLPGNLKRNVVVKRVSPSNLTSEHVVTVRGKKKDGYAARYGRLVEYGTVNMTPRPFLRPAFDQNITAAISAMKKKGEQRIAAVVKGISKPRGKK